MPENFISQYIVFIPLHVVFCKEIKPNPLLSSFIAVNRYVS